MEENKTQTPEWVEAARKWQDENKEARSLFIIASTEDGITNIADGFPIVLINSIYQNLKQNPTIARYIKDAQDVAKGGIAERLFNKAFEKHAEEHGIKFEERNPLDMKLKDILGLGSTLDKDDE